MDVCQQSFSQKLSSLGIVWKQAAQKDGTAPWPPSAPMLSLLDSLKHHAVYGKGKACALQSQERQTKTVGPAALDLVQRKPHPRRARRQSSWLWILAGGHCLACGCCRRDSLLFWISLASRISAVCFLAFLVLSLDSFCLCRYGVILVACLADTLCFWTGHVPLHL